MEALANDLNPNDSKKDLRWNPGSQINDHGIRTREDRHELGMHSLNRSKNRRPRNGNSTQCPQPAQAKTQPSVAKPDFLQFHKDLHRNGFPMNPESHAESVVLPVQVGTRHGLHLFQALFQNPLDRGDIKHEMKIIPSDQRCGMRKRTHRQ